MTRIIPEVPFTLYTIEENWDGVPALQTATVTRVTPKWWWFRESDTHTLAFNCRVHCAPFSYHLTADAAWQAYARSVEADVKAAQQRLDRLLAVMRKQGRDRTGRAS